MRFTTCSYKRQVKRNHLSLSHIRTMLLSYEFMDSFFCTSTIARSKHCYGKFLYCFVVEYNDRSRLNVDNRHDNPYI